MATFFGEILPVISRAVDDDDDIPPKTKPVEFEWRKSKDEVITDSLIIGVGDVSSCFLASYYDLDDSNLIGVIRQIEDDIDDDHFEVVSKKSDIMASCYRLLISEKSFIFVISKSYVSPEQIWPWTLKLFENITPSSDVIVMTSSTVHELKCENFEQLNLPAIKSLTTTTKPSGHPVFPTLEQPNMLKNIPAAVITYCEFHKIPAAVYACYTETLNLDLVSVQAFSPLLETPQYPIHKEKETAVKKILEKIRNSGSGKNLYI